MERDYQNWKVSYIVGRGKADDEKRDRTANAIKTNKKLPGKAPHLIDDDQMKGKDDLTLVDHVDHDLKMAIQQGRNNKGWNQSELAQRLCVKPDIIKSYENGTAIPDNAFVSKIERVLECKLPRHKKAK